MRQKLVAKGFETDEVEHLLTALVEERLLSDERFTESFIRSRVNKGVGPVRLRKELREHEIDSGLIGQYLQDQDWHQLATEVRAKRFGRQVPEDYKERMKQMRFLQYRGFDSDQINGAMQQSEWALYE